MSTNPHAGQDRPASRGDIDRTTSDTVGRNLDGDRTSTYRDDDLYPTLGTAGRREVVEREREQHGGIKIGSAFFGWLTATGTAVLLTALLAAAGTAIGLSTGTDVDEAASAAANDPTIGIVGAVALLLVLFVSYYCGGYVAGRMARFDGAKQGVAVWLWAIVIAVILAVLGAAAGTKFNVLANLNSFPRIPIGEGDLSTAGILAAIGVVVASLAGAILGGIAGMRFHRRVDRTGFGDD